ncbi:MAG: Kelch repeat-containing protein [Bacteroidia bacterium]
MKKFLLLSITILTVTFLTAQSWVQKNNFPGVERYSATGFEINGKLYMGTGYNGMTMMSDWWEYDPATDQWTQKASFPGAARFAASSFAINNKGYVIFGSTSYGTYSFPKDLWEYDPANDQWIQKALFPGQGRYTAVSMEINGKGYVGTGWKQVSPAFLSDFWEYNPATNTWTQKASFAGGARQSASGFSLNGKGYLGLGGAGSTVYNDFWEYNQNTNAWIQKASFPGNPRADASSFVLNGNGYLGSGGNGEFGSNAFTDFYKFDPSTNSWSNVNGFSPGRMAPVSFAIGSCSYVVTGRIGAPSSLPSPQTTTIDFWEYCLITNINETNINDVIYITNPIIGEGFINILSANERVKIEVYNLSGKFIKNLFEGNLSSNTNLIKFNLNHLASGIYIIRSTIGSEVYNNKLVNLTE